jgi:hypothetical protein
VFFTSAHVSKDLWFASRYGFVDCLSSTVKQAGAHSFFFSCGAAIKLQWHAICLVNCCGLNKRPAALALGNVWGGTYKKNLSGGRTLPAQCITCGHEHQNQSKSNNHQSAPLPKTNHIDWTQHSQSPCCLTGPETCFSGQ